jgi:hypothetical protein
MRRRLLAWLLLRALSGRRVLVGIDVGTENEKLFEYACVIGGMVDGHSCAVICAGERVGI